MKPGAGQGSPLRVAPCPVQSDTGQNYYMPGARAVRRVITIVYIKASRVLWPSPMQYLGAWLAWERFAVQYLGANLAWEWDCDPVQTLVGSLWRWRRRERGGVTLWTSSCDHAATSSAVLYRISYDVGVVPQLSSSTVWTVYEMACFLCFPLL